MSDTKMASTTDEFLAAAQRSVSARLARLRRKWRCELAFELVAQAVAMLVAVGAVLVAVDWMFRLELPARLTLLIGSLTTAATALVVRQWSIWKAANVSD